MRLLKYLKWDKVFFKNVMFITLPILMQSIVGQTLHLVDNVMVSQLGDAAYAGVAQANRYTMVINVMLFGVATGSSIFLAQYWGSKEISEMKKSLGLGLVWGCSLAFLMGLLGFFATDTIISLFLQRGESFNQAVIYLKTISPAFIMSAISNAYASALKSEEKTKYPMIAGIISMVVNTILNYLLIMGNFGFPKWGVFGAALATLIASIAGMAINIYFAFSKSLSGKANFKELFSFNKAFINKYNKTASPVILTETLWSLGTAVYSIFYGMRGDAAVAAMGVFSTLDGLTFIIIYAIVSATSIIVGKELGAGNKQRAELYAKRLTTGTVTFSVVIALIAFIFRYLLFSIFSNLSKTTLDYAMVIFIISLSFSWMRSFNSVLIVGILRAGGDTVASLIIDVAFLWFVAIPLLGLGTVFTALPISILYLLTLSDEVLKFIFGMRRFVSGKWAKTLTQRALE
ncbi:MAG: MATE family efflux transporter [Christensenellaceae bacterium]|nr:MATE family efflux transporter [Christensenellaceae bacterium]